MCGIRQANPKAVHISTLICILVAEKDAKQVRKKGGEGIESYCIQLRVLFSTASYEY